MAIAAMTSSNLTVDQTSHRLVCDTLRRVLRQLTQAESSAVEEIGSMLYRVSAVVYTLLLDHPIDRRGRCRSCRRPGPLIGLRRRPCRIYLKASYWLLRQPNEVILQSQLADDLGLRTVPAAGAETRPKRSSQTLTAPIDLDDTTVPSAGMDDPRTEPPLTPSRRQQAGGDHGRHSMVTVRQNTTPSAQQPASISGSDPPLIDSPAAAAEALRDYFMANADRGDNAANDELVAELVRHIRTRQDSHAQSGNVNFFGSIAVEPNRS